MDSSTQTNAGDATSQPLSPLEARVLGCLIEKELTTPEYYPLSLNALVNACNQKSNRQPVIAATHQDVEVALDGLRRLRLAGLFAGADARVPKFKQTVDLVYPMEKADRVVLCELLLRGPQTPGELRAHCERMHGFEGVGQIEEALERLAHRPAGPLVTTLPRQPGQKEVRRAQTLTGEVTFEETSPETAAQPGAMAIQMRLPEEAESRIAALERDVSELRTLLEELRRELGLS